MVGFGDSAQAYSMVTPWYPYWKRMHKQIGDNKIWYQNMGKGLSSYTEHINTTLGTL